MNIDNIVLFVKLAAISAVFILFIAYISAKWRQYWCTNNDKQSFTLSEAREEFKTYFTIISILGAVMLSVAMAWLLLKN